ncbi:hypothetical protein BpHYR1_040922 [Brachionus plicatilis]|uniref:Uncharacterized protein n=1 Tax=Brachionus plicatilis TaxID=10195 RepID=A0A3M7SHB8_BRAPC|nr:hypothetical protein BpHYR1_040922 [Brachionus plicatilis]
MQKSTIGKLIINNLRKERDSLKVQSNHIRVKSLEFNIFQSQKSFNLIFKDKNNFSENLRFSLIADYILTVKALKKL